MNPDGGGSSSSPPPPSPNRGADAEAKEEEHGRKQVVVVLVGPPGSGKSTFADAVVAGSTAGRSWVRICQVGPMPSPPQCVQVGCTVLE